MGKKYGALKEELARNQSRDVLVVNDQLIRQKYFHEANDVLKKIENIESKIRTFHSSDQRLFDQWYKLTFQGDQDKVDALQTQYRHLAQFHNWVLATAEMLDLEMPEAYGRMKEEEQQYVTGDENTRRRIEREREKRDAFIESQVHGRYNEDSEFNFDDDGSESEEKASPLFAQILDSLEEVLLKDQQEPEYDTKKRIDRMIALSDEELEYALKDQETAFLLFDLSLSWSEHQGDPTFFLKIWKLMSRRQRATFSEVYFSLTGKSLDDLVRIMKRQARAQSSQEEEIDPDEDEDFSFNEEYIQRGAKFRPKDSAQTPAQEETLKTLYRKLIRRLHPDLHASETAKFSSDWIKRVWENVQKAYSSKDISSLDKLLKLTLLRMNALDQLTIDEISDARKWLQKDLTSLEREAGQLKKSMAWGFSGKKDYSTLLKKIKAQFQDSFRAVRGQITELEDELHLLDLVYTMDYAGRPASRKRKSRPSKKSHSRKRSQRRHFWDEEDQQSFSFEDFENF